MDYAIETTYSAGALARVTLPDNLTWDDLADWYIKWDTLHYTLADRAEWRSVELNSEFDPEMIDTKRPRFVTVFPITENGQIDYETEIASHDEIY